MEIFHQTKLGTGLRAVSLNTRLAKRAVLATAGWIAAWPLFGGVVINEIHYYPTSEDVREEFVELHNTGDQAVNLESGRCAAECGLTSQKQPCRRMAISSLRQTRPSSRPSTPAYNRSLAAGMAC